ncbi:DUF4365 domain-containing protein [Halomicrobium salinisoli]|uniref:DUF4365 domain-containing protein n=1 Tax=Halomicrobium salinisoli TaxID=2878391 RepID=UPI001CEFFAA2|nr:DUF4365 domain-containing protein [Halomicrobium salinisoli]
MAKKRSSNQQLEQASRGELISRLDEFVVNSLDNDFELDFQVTVTEQRDDGHQEVQSINFYIQLKASEEFAGDRATFDIPTDDLELYVETSQPVVLALYDDAVDQFYWTVMQDYIWDTLNNETPEWREQDYNRIHVNKQNTFGDTDALKDAVVASQKRIIRRQNMGLGLGEGVHFSSADLGGLDREINSSLLSFKGHSLIKSQELMQQGNMEEARETLIDVYNAPEKDEGKLKALVGLTHTYNSLEPEEAVTIIELSEEAIDLAQDLDTGGLEYYTKIHKHQSELFILLEKTEEILVSLKFQGEDSDAFFAYYFNETLIELLEEKIRIFGEINDALNQLVDRDHLYEFIVSLPIVLDYISNQIMRLTQLQFVDKAALGEEKHDHPLVKQCEQILDIVDDPEIRMLLGKSLGRYYYFTLEPEKAITHFTTGISGAEELGDEHTVEFLEELLDDVEDRPDPYEREEVSKEEVEEMSLSEYQEMATDMLEMQGINLDADNEDRMMEAVQLGVKDINQTEYFRHCEHLRIRQLSTSPLGQWLNLHTLGTKMVWCKHAGAMESVNLELAFNGFKDQYCEGCEHHCPRPDDWEPNLSWWEEQAQDPELEEFLEKREDPWSQDSG